MTTDEHLRRDVMANWDDGPLTVELTGDAHYLCGWCDAQTDEDHQSDCPNHPDHGEEFGDE